MKLYELNDMIAAVCPIHGINTNGAVFYKPEATPQQKAVAQTVFDANWPIDGISEQETVDAAAKTSAKADNVVQYLRDHTPAEVEAYVQANVTDLASAKQLMKKFAVVLCVLTKDSLR